MVSACFLYVGCIGLMIQWFGGSSCIFFAKAPTPDILSREFQVPMDPPDNAVMEHFKVETLTHSSGSSSLRGAPDSDESSN